MSETGTGTAAQPGVNPAAQPAQTPASFVQIDPAEYSRLKRSEEQARGAAQFYEKAKSAGFDRPEAFESYAQQQARLKKYGVDVNGILSSFESERGEAAPAVDTEQIIRQARESALGEVDKRYAYHENKGKHGEQLSRVQGEVDKFTDGVDDLTATEKKWLKADILREVDAARRSNDNLYDPEHPLREYDFKPLASEKLASILSERKKELAAVKASRLEAKGVAAQKPSGTPAGNGTTQGKPNNDKATVPFGKLSREEQAEIAKNHLAKKGRGGAAVSSVAGA